MSLKLQGDVNVLRSLTARRTNVELSSSVISAQEGVTKHDPMWRRLSAAGQQDAVLPDATTLSNGWKITLESSGAATVRAMKYDAVTPTLLQAMAAGEAWEFTLLDNSTAAGVWHSNKLEATAQAARYAESFDATTSWGSASGGYYTLTVPQSTHGITSSPNPALYELSGSDFVKVGVDELKALSNGDVTIRVPETPDGRFAGKVVIS